MVSKYYAIESGKKHILKQGKNVFGFPQSLKDYWVLFYRGPGGIGNLRKLSGVLISKETGEIEFDGEVLTATKYKKFLQ